MPRNNYNSALNWGLGSDTPSLGGSKARSVLYFQQVTYSLSLTFLISELGSVLPASQNSSGE